MNQITIFLIQQSTKRKIENKNIKDRFMRKKNYFVLFTIFAIGLTIISSFFATKIAHAQEDIMTLTQNAGYITNESYRPKASIVADAQTGQIIWSENPDLIWEPASIAKLMTIYLVFQALEEGKFTLDTTIKATESDAAISQIYELSNSTIIAEVDYPIHDLISMTVVASSNASTIMLANFVTNNDAAKFINKMNEQAKTFGMTNTMFYNPSGAQASAFNGLYTPAGIDPNADNTSTAKDLAILGYQLLKKYPEILNYTKDYQVTVMENTPYAEVLTNSNQSIPGGSYSYEGEDGLKTGSSPNGAFNYMATAKRGDTRLIEVVLGVGDWDDQEGESQRHAFGNTLFDYGFSTYEYKKVLDKGTCTINDKKVTLEEDLYGLVAIGSTPSYTLANNRVTLDNGLAQLSPTIPVPSVGYQSVKKTIISKTTKNDSTGSDKQENNWINYLFCGIAVVIGSLLLLLDRSLKKHLIVTRQKSKYPVRIRAISLIGWILLLSGIGYAFFLFLIN